MKRAKIVWLVLLAASILTLVESLSIRRVQASTFTVVTTADNGNDASPTPGSLRQAIIFANGSPGLDTINFNIPGPILNIPTIAPPSFLPVITDSVIIDGTTQGLFGLVELDGENAGSGVSGLILTGNGCVIEGLVINRFSNNGLTIAGSNNTIKGCYLGTDTSGTAALGNGNRGIFVNGSSFTA